MNRGQSGIAGTGGDDLIAWHIADSPPLFEPHVTTLGEFIDRQLEAVREGKRRAAQRQAEFEARRKENDEHGT